MKILYVTTIGMTMGFFKKIVRQLLDAGHQVDIACNDRVYPVADCYREWGCNVFTIDCSRNPFSTANLRAVRQLRELAASGGYDVVHCHTPVAGVCTRLACKPLRQKGLRVFYTAHGFHFYRGAPLKNWLLYYPPERLCAPYTDLLITINQEDYAFAKTRFPVKHIALVSGVGVDLKRFREAAPDEAHQRSVFGIPNDAFLMISVGELNANKNHQIAIRALALLNDPKIHYLIVGEGAKADELQALAAKLCVADQVHLAGYHHDVAAMYKIADINVFPSVREGLGLAAVEGMAAGLPLVCADNRGTREYAPAFQIDGFCGMCHSAQEYAAAIRRLQTDPALCEKLRALGQQVAEKFSVTEINRQMMKIYEG